MALFTVKFLFASAVIHLGFLIIVIHNEITISLQFPQL